LSGATHPTVFEGTIGRSACVIATPLIDLIITLLIDLIATPLIGLIVTPLVSLIYFSPFIIRTIHGLLENCDDVDQGESCTIICLVTLGVGDEERVEGTLGPR
jgi:hypothetical protein